MMFEMMLIVLAGLWVTNAFDILTYRNEEAFDWNICFWCVTAFTYWLGVIILSLF